jgi:hypothetical protein
MSMRTVPGRGIVYVAFGAQEEAAEALLGLHGATPFASGEDGSDMVPLEVTFRVDRFPQGNTLATQVGSSCFQNIVALSNRERSIVMWKSILDFPCSFVS